MQDVAGLWSKVLAKPPVRKYAKDQGVDLAEVTGSGEPDQPQAEVTAEEPAADQPEPAADTPSSATAHPAPEGIDLDALREANAKPSWE